jgi:hypothetical protein
MLWAATTETGFIAIHVVVNLLHNTADRAYLREVRDHGDIFFAGTAVFVVSCRGLNRQRGNKQHPMLAGHCKG